MLRRWLNSSRDQDSSYQWPKRCLMMRVSHSMNQTLYSI